MLLIWNLVGGIDGDKTKHWFLTTVEWIRNAMYINVIYV